MTKAIQLSSEELNISIPEFTVSGIPHGNFFAHDWYVACDDKVDTEVLRTKIDNHLKELNDDYAVERNSALKDVFLTVLPENKFMDFMGAKGKVGGQHKFPRVVKGKMYQDWKAFLLNGKF
jgi:hypothetical protein